MKQKPLIAHKTRTFKKSFALGAKLFYLKGMKLKTYLKKTKTNMTVFAKMIDRDVSTVSRLIAGETQPDWMTMDRIILVTGGKVKPNDFIGINES